MSDVAAADIAFHFTRKIPHSPERVFDALTHLEGLAPWLPGLVGIERLTDGPYGVGTAWWESRRRFGLVLTEHVQVVRAERPRHLTLRVDGSLGTARRGVYDFSWTLESEDEGTMLTFRGEGRGLGRPGRLFARFLAGPFQRACEADVDALAIHLGSDEPPLLPPLPGKG